MRTPILAFKKKKPQISVKTTIDSIKLKKAHRVFFVISSLKGGGAEKALVEVIRGMDSSNFDIHIMLHEREGVYFDNLPKNVGIHFIDHSPRIIWYGFGWLFLLFKFIRFFRDEKPDVIVSFTWYVNFVVLMLKVLRLIQFPVIVTEHSTLSFTPGWIPSRLRANIIRFIYPYANRIVPVSRAMQDQFKCFYNIPHEKLSLIYNPVDFEKIRQAAQERVDHLWCHDSVPLIIAVGRLHPAKGFPYLIKAFSILRKDIEARLIILGEGEERENLQQLIDQLGLANDIDLMGFEKNPYKYLSTATIFVLSSVYEGFPIALVEAMAVGIPCIATRCKTGPEEIITDGINGLLVPPADENSLAMGMKTLIKDVNLRKRLSQGAKYRAEEFRVEKIVKQYERLIMRVMEEQPSDTP